MYIYIARGPGFESHSGQLSIWNRKTLPQYEYHIYLYIFYIYIYIYIYVYIVHITHFKILAKITFHNYILEK